MASLGAVAAPAAAQNSTAPPPVITIPPPTQTEAPPAPPAPGQPGSTAAPNLSEPVEPSPPQDVVVAPQPDPVPAEPVTIDPDAAYPEGFADPEDPFANDMADAYRQDESGFDWGLLGLLGLLGLIPLFRRRGAERVVYVERDDVGRRRGEG
jgi:hypothetical protein